MPRGRNAKKNGPSFYETCRQAGESEEELEQGPSKPSASAGRSSARGSKRGQAADEALDVDDLPERDANKAHKHHEGAGAAGNVASDGDEDRGSMIGARAAPSEFGARAGRPTRSRTASNQASPLAPELPDRKRVQSRLPSPLQGAAAARRRTPTLRSVEAQQQSAEAAAARESRARRRNGTSPPKALYEYEHRNTLISGLQSLPPFRRPECFRHKREHANYVLNGEQCAVCRPPELLRLLGVLRSRSGVGREPFCLMSVLEVER